MNRLFVLTLALSASAAFAQAADRYGPSRASDPDSAAGAPSSYLTWAGKTPASAGAAAVSGRPQPIAPWAQKLASQTAAQPAPALPTSLYAPTPPSIAPSPVQNSGQNSGQAYPSAPAAPVQQANANNGARRYSVGREFGIEPDPIPMASRPSPKGQVITLTDVPGGPTLERQQAAEAAAAAEEEARLARAARLENQNQTGGR